MSSHLRLCLFQVSIRRCRKWLHRICWPWVDVLAWNGTLSCPLTSHIVDRRLDRCVFHTCAVDSCLWTTDIRRSLHNILCNACCCQHQCLACILSHTFVNVRPRWPSSHAIHGTYWPECLKVLKSLLSGYSAHLRGKEPRQHNKRSQHAGVSSSGQVTVKDCIAI